jgi:hypothetical protein
MALAGLTLPRVFRCSQSEDIADTLVALLCGDVRAKIDRYARERYWAVHCGDGDAHTVFWGPYPPPDSSSETVYLVNPSTKSFSWQGPENTKIITSGIGFALFHTTRGGADVAVTLETRNDPPQVTHMRAESAGFADLGVVQPLPVNPPQKDQFVLFYKCDAARLPEETMRRPIHRPPVGGCEPLPCSGTVCDPEFDFQGPTVTWRCPHTAGFTSSASATELDGPHRSFSFGHRFIFATVPRALLAISEGVILYVWGSGFYSMHNATTGRELSTDFCSYLGEYGGKMTRCGEDIALVSHSKSLCLIRLLSVVDPRKKPSLSVNNLEIIGDFPQDIRGAIAFWW